MTIGSACAPLSDGHIPWCYTCHLTMKTHISNLVRTSDFELRRISFTRHLLSTDAIKKTQQQQNKKTLVSAFVLSRPDSCNSLLSGCPQYLLNKLQKVQNNPAHLIPRVPITDHTYFSPRLASFHWLLTDSQIQYKLASLCYNCLNSTAPGYFTELFNV